MHSRRSLTTSRLAVPLLLPGGIVLAGATARSGLRLLQTATAPGADPAAAVAGLASVTVAVIVSWLTVCLLLALLAELPGAAGRLVRRLRDAITPALVQRWAAVALGASVTATVTPGTAVSAIRPLGPDDAEAEGPTGPSSSFPGWTRDGPPATPSALPRSSPGWAPAERDRSIRTVTDVPAPGWVPRRPPTRQQSDPHLLTGRGRTAPTEDHVVVQRGDTLWSLAAARLGPGATDLEIARAWPRWHAANTDVIGADPHHLLPGTRLEPPQHDP